MTRKKFTLIVIAMLAVVLQTTAMAYSTNFRSFGTGWYEVSDDGSHYTITDGYQYTTGEGGGTFSGNFTLYQYDANGCRVANGPLFLAFGQRYVSLQIEGPLCEDAQWWEPDLTGTYYHDDGHDDAVLKARLVPFTWLDGPPQGLFIYEAKGQITN